MEVGEKGDSVELVRPKFGRFTSLFIFSLLLFPFHFFLLVLFLFLLVESELDDERVQSVGNQRMNLCEAGYING